MTTSQRAIQSMTDLRDYSKLYDENETEIIEKVFKFLYEKLLKQEFINETVEIIDAHFKLNPMKPYLDFGTKKKASRKYIVKEIAWYLSNNLSILGYVDDVEIWKKIATKNTGYVNSNYGWCLFSRENGEQYKNALQQLLDNPDGRQSVCIYTRPSIQIEWNDGIHADHDFICTHISQHLIRNKKLEYIVYQRSADQIFGVINDFAWHSFIYQKMLCELNEKGLFINPGIIHYNAGSAHIYERHYQLLKDIISEYTCDDKQRILFHPI
jgi:thymidylate synthase